MRYLGNNNTSTIETLNLQNESINYIVVLTNDDVISLNRQLFELEIFNITVVSIEFLLSNRKICFYEILNMFYDDNDEFWEKNSDIDDINMYNIRSIEFTNDDIESIYEYLIYDLNYG